MNEVSAEMENLADRLHDYLWEPGEAGYSMQECREIVDALGLAALLARVWDEGYKSGHSNAMRRMSDEPNAPTTPNPYRREGSEKP